MATFPTYPATSLEQGVDLVIFSSNQLHDVINGSATESIETESGLIPTLRKALVDNFFFKSPLDWAQGTNETVFNQLRYFQNGVLSGYYYAPNATLVNPIPMQGTPVGDNNWVLWGLKTEQLATEVTPWVYSGATGYETVISPPYIFDSAIVTINGVIQVLGEAFRIEDSKIILSEPLGHDPATGLPNKLFAYIGKIVASADTDPNLENRLVSLETKTEELTESMDKVPLQTIARKYGLLDDEVAYATAGQSLTGIKALYDPVAQSSYTLPPNITGTLTSLSVSGVMTYSGGSVDLSALAVERGQFVHLPTSFGNNVTLTAKNQTIGRGAGRYRWAGSLPKSILASDTLETSGGLGPNAWVLTNTEGLLTPRGGTYNDLFDVVYLSEFANNTTAYTTPEAAFQAALLAAKASKSKILDAYGCDMTFTTSSFDIQGITLRGGVFRGQRDYRVQNATVEGTTFRNSRVMYWGGAVRMFDCLWDGAPRAGQVGSLVFQGNPISGTFEIDNCTFKNGLYGILQQGTGEPVTRGVFRNLTFMDMQGDAIELNVINKHYDDGCVIENIYLSNIDGTNAPIPLSNWGIGIGVAGKGPYGYGIPDDQYCKNITIRNVFAKRCRQIVHVEVGRNISIENIHGDPDQTVSVGTGLATGAVVMYGSKDFTIDGVYGEPKTDGSTLASNIRMIYLEWGTNAVLDEEGNPVVPAQGRPSNPCFNYSVRNIHTKTGRVFAGVSAGPGYENRVSFENIRCAALQLFGIASWLSMSNITCNIFDCVGQPESGPGTFYDGFFRREKSVLEMVNVNCYPDGKTMVTGRPQWSRCRYSDIHRVNCNVEANMYTNIAGGIGAIVGTTGKVYYLEPNPSRNIDGMHFPTGKEFDKGDMIVKADNTFFLVTTSGAYIPDIPAFGIRATQAGDTFLTQNLTPNGTATNASWLYHYPLSAGTRIRIPGAGVGGADLDTVITRAPYQDNDTWTNPVKIDIADPIVTPTSAGVRIKTIPNDSSNVSVGNTAVIRPTPVVDVPTT
ncbi:TPA: hypothetical protein J9755_000216 [Escherichia coli]|nr:hypothetical protein [Escherichia coli]